MDLTPESNRFGCKPFVYKMHKFVHSLLTEWRKLRLPFAEQIFIVAVSGGADSVSLALALHELRERKKLNLRFVLAHFNHQLRGIESDADEQFVKNFAERFGFELACGRIENSESKIDNQKGNLEQNARLARYRFLFQTAENLNASAVLTAHTLNDQAETFLMNLIRGSGLEGLGVMKAIRNLESDDELRITNYELREEIESTQSADQSKIENQKSEIRLIRPLLKWAKREATENYCREREIDFRLDAMNDDLGFRRVRVRKVLLPLLADFNPNIVETLAQTANLLQEDFIDLQRMANSIGKRSPEKNKEAKEKHEDAVLELKELKNLFPSMRRQILRQWLKECRGGTRSLDLKHIEAIENLISSRKSGREVQLPNGETVIKNQGKIFFKKTKVEKTPASNYNQGLDSGGRA